MESKYAKVKKLAAELLELKSLVESDKNLLDILNKFKDEKDKDRNFPINASNIYQVKKFIDSWTAAGKDKIISLRFQLLWSKIRYFQNLLKFSGDEFLESYGHRLFQLAIVGGVAAVVKHPLPDKGSNPYGNDKLILSASPVRTDPNGDVLSAKVFPGLWLGPNMGSQSDALYNKLLKDKQIKVSDPKYTPVFLKWESTGVPYLLMLIPFLNILESLIKMLQINIPAGMHRWLYELNTAKPTKVHIAEITQLIMNRYSPVWIKANTGSGIDSEIKSMRDKEAKIPPNEFTRNDLSFFMNLMSYITGEFTNLSEKSSERNINAEVTINTSYFHITQQEFLAEARLFVARYNKVFKANAQVNFCFDLEQHTDNPNQSDSLPADEDTDNRNYDSN